MATALYNRYRPRTFAEVVGQTQVTDALAQALRSDRAMHHAYLFSGPRGCGKTSSARILAASLNCVNGPTPEPCGVCEQCVSIRSGTSVDVVEIDAASHGLVEDTRDLRERAAFMPASGRFRVFIVDEAHMITTQGFNALLKIVEEPPEYVVFVFATTDPDKVLSTIKSRTFHYQFGLVPPRILEAHLTNICAQEGVNVDPAVLPLVVRVAEGSVRDSLSVLDQLLAGADESGLSYAVAAGRLGLTDALLLDEMLDGLARREAATVFGVVQRVVEAGQDPRRFTLDLLERLRDLLLLEAVPDAPDRGMLDACPADQLDRMRSQAARLGAAELSRAADVTHTALVDMRGTSTPRMVLELLCARILLPGASGDGSSLLVRLDRIERRLQAGGPPTGNAAPSATPVSAPSATPPQQPPARPAPAPAAARPAQMSRPETAGQEAPAPRAETPAARAQTPAPRAQTPAPRAETPAPRADAASAWPEPARPQGVAAAVPAAPAEQAAPPIVAPTVPTAAGTIDVNGLRGMWPQILESVKVMQGGRTPHALLAQHAEIAAVEGQTVTLSFLNPSPGRLFSTNGVHVEKLEEALTAQLGGKWRVKVGSAPSPPRGGAAASPAPEPAQAPSGAGFAPGDEPEPEDDEPTDGPVETEPRRRGEDLAVDLLKAHMGGTVIGELDNV